MVAGSDRIDGQFHDWRRINPLATDPKGDANRPIRRNTVFAIGKGTRHCVAYDCVRIASDVFQVGWDGVEPPMVLRRLGYGQRGLPMPNHPMQRGRRRTRTPGREAPPVFETGAAPAGDITFLQAEGGGHDPQARQAPSG